MLSVASLRKASTTRQVYAWLIDLLKSVGFETTGWQPGRIQRSMFTAFATGAADLTELGKFITEFGFGPTSTGPGLTLFSRSRYTNERILARKTAGPMRLRNFGGVTYTVEPYQIIVSEPVSGIEFRNTQGGTILPGSTGAPSVLDLQFEAVVAGRTGNVARGAVTNLVTSFAGVTVSNDVTDITSGTWYTTVGTDEELDSALQRRNETKWALSSLELVKEGFEALALQNGAVKVDIDDTNPRGQGTLDVYAASESAPLSSAEMQALQLAFSRRVLRTEATWLNPWPVGNASLIQVKHPPTQELSLAGGIVYYTGELTTVQALVRQALLDLIILAPIGGYNYAPGPTNVITQGDLTGSIEDCDGVATTDLNLTADIAVASRHLVIPPADPLFGLEFIRVTG